MNARKLQRDLRTGLYVARKIPKLSTGMISNARLLLKFGKKHNLDVSSESADHTELSSELDLPDEEA